MKTIRLDGIWKLRGATEGRGALRDWPKPQRFLPSYDAAVPGTVQEAMEWMTGDVHVGHNVYHARFIEEQYWLYSRAFSLTEEDLTAPNRVRLVFEGLDLNAVVYVNGTEVGRHENFYLPCRLDVTRFVHAGENTLDVRLESGIIGAAEKDTSALWKGSTMPMLRRAWLRKPQSAFEWDWSPRLLNVGIHKPCRVEIAPCFANETAVLHELSQDDSKAQIRVRQFVQVSGERELELEAWLEETGEGAAVRKLCRGEDVLEAEFPVVRPRLWYPRGQGEQFRYRLRLTVRDRETGEVLHEDVKKVGLRRVEIDQSDRPAGGKYFRLLVNGKRLFAKGANMIPADILFSKPDRKDTETLIDRAVEENFNALRVWGGGVYESDDFYDLCDEKGIVVWQDFVNACGTCPAWDREWFDNYTREVTFQIRRLSVYASPVIYSGNNEIDWFAVDPEYHIENRYTDASLYYAVLPRILRTEGERKYYQPSSPWSPDGMQGNDDTVGDQHPWSIGFANRDYFGYRNMECRFPNEGGILGPTSLPNVLYALGEGQKYLHSTDFKIHDNYIADPNDQAPELLLEEKLGISIERGGMSLEDYVYYGGFLQGEGLTEYVLNFRRRMCDTTGSAIFWMYEDCWPATRSWTTVDYLRNRTPSFHPVRRAFAPVAVDLVRRADGGFDVYGISDLPEEKEAKLLLGYARGDGGGLRTWETSVRLPANDSAVIASLELPGEDFIPFAELSAEGQRVARRRWVDRPYNTLGLKKTEIRSRRVGDAVEYVSDGFVFGVCLDLDGSDGGPEDNFFDLYPGRPYRVKPGRCSGEILYRWMG